MINTIPHNKINNFQGEISRVVVVMIKNKKGDFFLQKRSKHESHYPLHWDCSVRRKVNKNKNYLQTAMSKAKEELGISLKPNTMQLVKKMLILTECKEQIAIFTVVHDGPFALTRQKDSYGKFFSLQRIREMLKNEEKFSPVLIQVLLQLQFH